MFYFVSEIVSGQGIIIFILNWWNRGTETKAQYSCPITSSAGAHPLLWCGEQKCFLRSSVVKICWKNSPFASCLLLLCYLKSLFFFSPPEILCCLLHLSKTFPTLLLPKLLLVFLPVWSSSGSSCWTCSVWAGSDSCLQLYEVWCSLPGDLHTPGSDFRRLLALQGVCCLLLHVCKVWKLLCLLSGPAA